MNSEGQYIVIVSRMDIFMGAQSSLLDCLLSWEQKEFYEKKLEDIHPFCGATDTPVLDFRWHRLPLLKISAIFYNGISF